MQVYVTTSRGVKEILARTGALATIEGFGADVVADTCIAVAPLVRPGAKVLMTNSGKYAHYGPGIIGVESIYRFDRGVCATQRLPGGPRLTTRHGNEADAWAVRWSMAAAEGIALVTDIPLELLGRSRS